MSFSNTLLNNGLGEPDKKFPGISRKLLLSFFKSDKLARCPWAHNSEYTLNIVEVRMSECLKGGSLSSKSKEAKLKIEEVDFV